MSVVVRAHDPGGTVSLIEAALANAPGAVASSQYVCVGDIIDTDEQVIDPSP